MAAQDLDEPFDLCDRDGNLLDQVKIRRAVHRDGDWHRALHLWVLLAGSDGPRVVLQRRSLAKDTHPGRVDVSVAGHLRAGETVDDALREADEEIGLLVAPSDVEPLGHRRVERTSPGGVDREVQTVLAVVCVRDFGALRPHPEEVDSLYAPTLGDALALARGERTMIAAERLDVARRRTLATLRADDLIAGEEAYRRRCLEALDAIVRGVAFERLRLE